MRRPATPNSKCPIRARPLGLAAPSDRPLAENYVQQLRDQVGQPRSQPVIHPDSFTVGLDQADRLEFGHVMGDCGLGQMKRSGEIANADRLSRPTEGAEYRETSGIRQYFEQPSALGRGSPIDFQLNLTACASGTSRGGFGDHVPIVAKALTGVYGFRYGQDPSRVIDGLWNRAPGSGRPMSSADLTAAHLAVPCARSQLLAALILAPRAWKGWVPMSAQLSLARYGDRYERSLRLVREGGAPDLGGGRWESSDG